jgi:hypothetical protein
MLHGTSHWKATIHTYSIKKFQKVQQLLGTYGSLPKNGKGHFGFLSPLGVKC